MADINRPSFTNLDQTTALENINNLQTGIKQGMQNIVSGDLANASSSLANITDQFNALVDSVKNNNMFEQLKDKIEQTNLMIDEFRIKTEKGIETQEKSIKSMTESLPKVLGLIRDMESSVEGLNKKFGSTAELEKFSSQIMDMKKNFDEIISMPLLDDGTAINSAKKVAQIYIDNMQTAFQMADIGKDIIISSLDNGKEEIANEIKKILSNTQVAMNIVPNINNYEGSGATGTDLSVFNKLVNEISVLNKTTAEAGEKTSKTLEKINAFLEAVDTTKVNEIPAVDKSAESTEVLKEIRQDLKNDGTPKAGDNIATSDTLKDYVNSIKDSLTKYSDLQNQVSEKAEKVQVAKEKYDEKPITRRKNEYEKANTDLEDTTKQLVAVAKEIIDNIKNYKENISPTISPELTINGENAKEQIENINDSAVQDLTKYDKEIDKIESIKQLLSEIQKLSDEYFSGTTESKAFDLNQISNFANKMNDIEKIFNSLESKEIIGSDSLENSKLLSAEIDKLINSLNNIDLASGILDSINDLDISKYITEKLSNTKIKLSNLLENDNLDTLQVSSLRNTEQTIKSIINNQNLENTTTEDNSYTNKSDIDNKSNLVNNVYQNVENIKSSVNSTYLADQVSGKNEYTEEFEDILNVIKDIERSVSLFQSVKQYANENTEFSDTSFNSSINVLFNNFSKLIEDLNTKTEKVKESSNYSSVSNDMSAINNLVSQYNTPVDNTENNEITNNIENLTRTIINSGSESNSNIVNFRDNVNDINKLFNDLNSELTLNISLDNIKLDLSDLNIGSNEISNAEDIDYINNKSINDITSNIVNNASNNVNSLSSLLNNISNSNQSEENNVNTTNTQNTSNSSLSNIDTDNTTNNLDNRQNSNISNVSDQTNSNIDNSNISNLNNQNTDISNLSNKNIDLSNISSLNNHNISDIVNNLSNVNTSSNNVSNSSNEVSNLSNVSESNQNNIDNTSTLNNQDSSISNVNQSSNESNSLNNTNTLNNIDNSNRENTNLSNVNNLSNENVDLDNVSSLNNQNINDIVNNLNNESASSTNINNISNNKNIDSNISNNQDNSSINRISQSNAENTNNLSLNDISNLSNEDIALSNINNQSISDIVNNLDNQRNISNTDNSNYEDNDTNISNVKNLNNSSNDINNLNNDITNLSNNISRNINKSNNENVDIDNVNTLNNQNISGIADNLSNTNIETTGRNVPSNNISNLSNQSTNVNNEINNLSNETSNLTNNQDNSSNESSSNENNILRNIDNSNNQDISLNNKNTNLNNEINNLNSQISNLNNNLSNNENISLSDEVNNVINQISNSSDNRNINSNNETNNTNNEISSNTSDNLSNVENTNLNNDISNINNEITNLSNNVNNLSNENVDLDNINNVNNRNISDIINNLDSENVNLNNVDNSNRQFNSTNNLSNLTDNSNTNNINNENISNDNTSSVEDIDIRSILNSINNENFTSDNTYSTNTSNLTSESNIDNSNYSSNETSTESNIDDLFKQLQLSTENANYNSSERVLDDILDSINIIQRLLEENPDSAQVTEVVEASVDKITHVINGLLSEDKTLPESQVEYFKDLASNLRYLKEDNGQMKFGGEVDILSDDSQRDITNLTSLVNNIENSSNVLNSEGDVLNELNSVNNQNIAGILNNIDTSTSSFSKNDTVEKIISITNQTLSNIVPELNKLHNDDLLKEITNSLSGIRNEIGATLVTRKDLPPTQTEELKNIINTIDETLHTKVEDTQISRLKENEILRTNEFESSVDKTEEKYNNIIFDTDESNPVEMLSAVDTFIDSLKQSVKDYENLAKSVTDLDLNKIITDKLELMSGTSQVIHDEFHENIDERQSEELTKIINQVNNYRDQKNDYINYANSVDNSNTDNSNNNGGDIINKNIFEKIEDFNDLDLNRILYTATGAKEQLRNTALDMMSGNLTTNSENNSTNIEAIDNIMKDYTSVTNSTQMMQSTINNINSLKEEYDNSEDKAYQDILKTNMENLYGVLIKLAEDINNSLSSTIREKNDLVNDNDNNRDMKGLSISLGRGNNVINQELNKISRNETYESEETNILYNQAFEDAAKHRPMGGKGELDDELGELDKNIGNVGQNLNLKESDSMSQMFNKIKTSSKEISDTSLVNAENLSKYIDNMDVSVDDLNEAIFMLDSILQDNSKQIIDNNQLENTLKLLTNIDNILKNILNNNGTAGIERNLTDSQVNKLENIRKINEEVASSISNTKSTSIDTDISDAQKKLEQYYSIIHYSRDIFERQKPSIGVNALKAVDKIDEIKLNDVAGNYSTYDKAVIRQSNIMNDLPGLKDKLLDINALAKDKSTKQDRISINMTELRDMVEASKKIPQDDLEKRGEAAEEIKAKVQSIEELLKSYTDITVQLNETIGDLDLENLKKVKYTETDTKDFSSLYEMIYDSIENDAQANNALIEVIQRFGMDTDENFIALYNNLRTTSKETADRISEKTSGGILGTNFGRGTGVLSGISGLLSMLGKGISGILGVASSIFNTVGRIFGVNLGISSMVSGTVDYYKKFGQMDVAGTQAQMKQGNIYTPGLLEYNKDVGIELYKRTYGLIGYDEYANQSNNLISQVQGHWGNDQSKVEGQMDMTKLSYPALLLNKVYDVDSTSAIKTFYKDIGMTAQETEAFMYKLVQTAQISNIPVSEYVKTIENLALKFKELGLNAEVADVSIQNLMLQGMDFQTASSMTGEYGSAISRFSQDNARTGFYGVMSGQFDTVWEGMKAARDRWNDDGSVKEGSSEIVAKMIDSELGMYSGILNSNEDYKWTYIQDYFQKLGFSEKNSAILTNKYTSGDMKGFSEFFEQASEEAEDENAVTLVNQDQLEAKLQVAADNTDELTKANSMLQATQMELARVSNNMIDLIGKGLQNTIAALGGIMLKLAEIIAKGVDALSPLLGKLIEHPILAILTAIAGKLGIKGIGSLLKKSATTAGTSGGIGSKLVNSLAAGSKTVPILSGVIDAGTSFAGDYFIDNKTAKYSAGSAAGKGVGTAVGAWGGAKAGAAIGTMIAPGVGTAIGTVIGAVAGGAGGHWVGKTATEAAMDSMGVQEYRNTEEKTVNNYNEYNSSGTNYSTNLTGMLTGTSGKQNDYTNAFYQYTGLTPYEIEPYESAFTNTYDIDDLYEIQDTQNNSTNKLLNQYQMSQERMTNLVTEKIEDAIDGKEFRDNGAKIELIAETLQNMGYDRETSYELAEKYVGKDMDGFNQKIKELTETMSDANKKIASNSYTFDTSVAGRGIASTSTTNNHNTTIYNATPQAMERLAEVPGATTDMSSGQYDEVINYIKTNTPRELTRSDIEDTNYQAMDAATIKQAEALTNILNRYEQNSTSTSLTQNFEKFNDDTMSILEKELNKANFANKNYGIELFGEDKEEAIMNLISTTAQDKEGLYELLAQEKYNLSDITDEFNSKFRERIESMGSAFARMNYGQKENAALQAALEVINEILKDTNKQITNNTDALKNAKLKIDTDAINSKLSELGIKTKASDLDIEALENKRALSAIKNQILQQDIKSNITNNQKTEDTLIQKNYAMSSSYMNSVDYVHELVDQYNSVGSGSYSKDLSTYQDNIAKTLSDGFLSNSKKFKDESDLFSTLGNSNETVLQLSSLAVGNKEELYSVLSKVAGNEGKISDLMEKLYSENMYKYREAVAKDGKELQGTAGYEVAVATEVMKDALKKENYLEDNDNDYVKYGTLESLTKNFRTDKLTSAAVSDINFGKQSNVLDNVDTKHDSVMLQGKSSSIYGDGTSKLTSEQSLETQEEIHDTLNQQIAESQNQANSVTNNFATIIDKASSEFELLQTIANIGNYILNCLRVTQSYNRNIAEDLEDIARAKVTMKVKTTNKISNSSNDSSKSSGSNKSNKSTGTQNASAGSLENPTDDFQFTGGIRGWLAGANNSSSGSSSNSNSGTSVMLGGSMGSGSSSGTPMGLREALSKTSSGSSSTASTSGGASHTASSSGGASSTASSSSGGSTPSLRGSLRTGSTSAMTSSYDEPMAYDYDSSPGYSSNPVSAASYTDSDYGISTAAYDYESDRSVYDGGGSGESGLGSINEQMDQWDDLVIEMANKYGMDPALIKSIIYQESGGDPNAQSYAGAMGLMQLMPGTAQEVASQLGWSSYDPYDPRQSVEMGTYYLSNLINTYDLQGVTDEATYANALAAYNWGIGNYLNSGQRSNVEAGNYSGLPGETQNYVSNIIGMYGQISNGTGNYSSSGSSSSRSHSSGSGLSAQEQLEEKYKKTFAQAEIYDIGSIEYSNGATVYNPDKYAGYDPLMDTSVYDMQGLARQIGESYSGQIDKYKADVDTVTSSSGNPSHNKQEFNIDINVGGGTDAVARTEAYARAVQEAITQVTKEYYGTTDVIGATIYNSNNSRY